MKKQFTQFKKDLKHPLAIMSLSFTIVVTLYLLAINLDKIIYFLGTSYYYIGISAGWIETF